MSRSSSTAGSELHSNKNVRNVSDRGTALRDSDHILLLERKLIEMEIDLAIAKRSEGYLKSELTESRRHLERIQRENAALRENLERSNTANRDFDVNRTGQRTTDKNSDDDSILECHVISSHIREGITDRIHRPPSCASGIALLTGTASSSSLLRESYIGPHERTPSCASGIALLSGNHSIPISALSLSSLLSCSLTKIAEADGATESNAPSSSGRRQSVSSSDYQPNEDWDERVTVQPTNNSNQIFERFLRD